MTLVISPSAGPALRQMQLLAPQEQIVDANVVDMSPGPAVFDHVVLTTADLPAPVLGIITLTTGSWAFAAAINLGLDTIRVPAGVTVYLAGMGWDKVLSSGATNVIEVLGTALIEGLAITGAVDGLAVQGGVLWMRACLITAAINGTRLSVAATSELDAAQCEWRVASRCVFAQLGRRIRIVDSEFIDTSGANLAIGVRVSGDLDYLALIGVGQTAGSDFVQRTSGAQTWATVNGCRCVVAGYGIAWAAANVPTNGLILIGNYFGAGTGAYNGLTHLSALVNSKGNTRAGALLSETPIVP
jgi:hypothetical protein